MNRLITCISGFECRRVLSAIACLLLLSLSVQAQTVLPLQQRPEIKQSLPTDILTPGMVLGGDRADSKRDGGALSGMNPVSILASAAEALPGQNAAGDERKPGGLSTAMNVIIVLTVIGLVPTILLMCTSFLRIVIVLSLLKQALGTAQMPPSQVMLGLSLILTLLVMTPTIDRINKEAIAPYRSGEIQNYDQLWNRAKQPVRDFMFDQIEATGNWSSLYMVLNYRGVDTSDPGKITRAEVDMISLVPAFVLSELKVAFLMGFRVYLPFLVIDMVISALLISMSMMMLPPVMISLPFKLLLFVMVDGWQLICGSLMTSFATSAPATSAAALNGGGVQALSTLAWAEAEPWLMAVNLFTT